MLLVEDIIDEKDMSKMLCSKREIDISLIPIYEDTNIYIDSLFSVEYNLQGDKCIYFRVLDKNPYKDKPSWACRLNIRRCKYVEYPDIESHRLTENQKEYLMKILIKNVYNPMFGDSNHTVWECIIESIFKWSRSVDNEKLRLKLLNKIPDYTKL